MVTDEKETSVRAKWLRKKYMGSVETRVQLDEQDDEQVAQHCSQACPGTGQETHALLLWPEELWEEGNSDTLLWFSSSFSSPVCCR